ncbi:hypothetical protein PR202_ga12874 [Eleusine coracana subsp. coracana]|uniref:Transposase Tnp1/En/Spm-like domain-containing protein n=1 Tax=Eleusine coracana subsp. coracana TaxID=191504 RepID=A0AAV5CCN7_ELECO|nr:hypothetical protein PR202_ga12874 [Eleusine coracana subsp. coracana]
MEAKLMLCTLRSSTRVTASNVDDLEATVTILEQQQNKDGGIFSWFMQTATLKWKEFRADLKKEFPKKYNEDMAEDELLDLCDERVHEADWKWLIDHWRPREPIAHSLRAKENHAKLVQNHTSGSKSHARVENEMNALKAAVIENPELAKKSIQEGDVYFHGGRDVILYSIMRPYDVSVAKATIQTTNPNASVGGTRLGVQFYEVVVNHVFARDAMLSRPYGKVKSLGEGHGRCIAWPRDRVMIAYLHIIMLNWWSNTY